MSNRRDPVTLLLAGLRFTLSVPLVRMLLSKLDAKNGDEYIADQVLKLIAKVDSNACLVSRFYAILLNSLIKVFTALTKADYEEVVKALRDPAVRRGLSLVIRGLAKYGVTTPQKLPAPFLIVWNFTNMCNLRCLHCYQRADKPLPNELTLEEKLDLVRQLDEAGVAAVALSGGEPTIHPHFFKVVEELSRRGIYVAVATNGWTLANERFAAKLKKAGVRYVEISIDSANPEKHDKFRGVKGAWERAVKGAKNAVKYGLHTAIAVTLTRYNIDEVDDLIGLAEELGVHKIIFFNFIPVGRGVDIVDLDLDPIEREKILRKLIRENQHRRVTVLTTAPQYARVSIQELNGEKIIPTHFYNPGSDPIIASLAEYIGGCGAGRIYAAIEPEGTVTPCVFMPIPVGNIKHKHFKEIWQKSELLEKLRDRDRLELSCGKCKFRYVCGGCRARAYAYTGNPLGPDPGCLYNIKTWEKIVKNLSKTELEKRTSTKVLLGEVKPL